MEITDIDIETGEETEPIYVDTVSETERWTTKDPETDKVICSAYVYKYVNKTWEFSRGKTWKQHRNKGHFTRLLQTMVDEYSYRDIKICACPMGDKPMSREQLIKYYERFGFVYKPGTKGVMMRKGEEVDE